MFGIVEDIKVSRREQRYRREIVVVKDCEKECIQLLTFGVKNVKGGTTGKFSTDKRRTEE